MYEHNALGYWSGLALCLTKVRSSRARCPATALIQLGRQPCSNSKTHVQIMKYMLFESGFWLKCIDVIGQYDLTSLCSVETK